MRFQRQNLLAPSLSLSTYSPQHRNILPFRKKKLYSAENYVNMELTKQFIIEIKRYLLFPSYVTANMCT